MELGRTSRRRRSTRHLVLPQFPPPTMAPVTALSSHERTRVEDYLNDKIQVSADLESLDSLLSGLRAQQELQRKQVSSPRNPGLVSWRLGLQTSC